MDDTTRRAHDPDVNVHVDVNADGTLAQPVPDLDGLHPNAVTVVRALAGLGVAGQVRELDERAATAADAAALLGIEVGAVANSLVFDADGEPLDGAYEVWSLRGMIRWMIPICHQAVQQWGTAAMILAVAGIV